LKSIKILSLNKFTSIVLFPFFRFQELIMNSYEQGKKARRIASVVYLVIMTIIMGGTYLSQQQKEAAEKIAQN
jgi:hypothetical protein